MFIISETEGIVSEMSDTPKTALEHFNASAESYEAHTAGCTRELAEHAIRLTEEALSITSESKILDNACGTGIVSDLLLKSQHISDAEPEIHAVDGSENMISIAAKRFPSYHKIHAIVMPGEELGFADGTFSHSITNLGLMFFNDALKGAKEIWRTLQPGGVATVTGWAALGYVEVIREVQSKIRPEDKAFNVPLPPFWLDPQHTVNVLTEAGFENLQMREIIVHFGGQTVEEGAKLLAGSVGKSPFATWTDEEKERALEELIKVFQRDAVPFTRGDGQGVGIKMKGTLFIARKN